MKQNGKALDKVHATRKGFDARLYVTACGRRGIIAKVPADVTCKRCASITEAK